jgi:tetratricopeptide (TPR) repeat protein
VSNEIDIEGLIVEAGIFLDKFKYAKSIQAAFEAASAMTEDDPRHVKVQNILFSAVQKSQYSITTLKTLGRYYTLRGLYDDAMVTYTSALRLSRSTKTRAELFAECASVLMTSVNEGRFENEADKNKRLVNAAEYLESALESGANPAATYSSLMHLYALKGNEERALFCAQKIVTHFGYNNEHAAIARKLLEEAAGFDKPSGSKPHLLH